MARRRRKDEEPEWTPPEFNEVDYMRREIESAKVAIVTVGWAAVGAMIAYVLYVFVHPAVGFLAGVAAFGTLYFLLPILGLPIKAFKTRDWIGHASIYFFSWLAFSIILLNPPFGDHTPPTVQIVGGGSYMSTNLSDPPVNTVACFPNTGTDIAIRGSSNNTVYLILRATDNVAVRSVNATAGTQVLSVEDASGRPDGCITGSNETVFPPGSYVVKLPLGGIGFLLTATATDTAGLPASASANVRFP